MSDAKENALKKPCCFLEREMFNSTSALRVVVEKHTYLEIKSASGVPILQMENIFQCCYSIETQPTMR